MRYGTHLTTWVTRETKDRFAALGRNINQIARAANREERVSDPESNQFRGMLTICNALRVNTKKLLQANAKSWEQEYEDQK